MAEVRVQVPGKVNLALAVGPPDERGYHPLATVFQAVSVTDELVAQPAPPGQMWLNFSGEGASFLPTDETNLVTRAARLLVKTCGLRDAGAEMHVTKQIPVAGGMAGGSADAAAALVALNELWQAGLGRAELAELAAQLGADVPFLLHGGTAIGTRYGDVIEPIPCAGQYHWTLAISHGGLSTPAVFRRFDATATPGPVQVAPELLTALAEGDVAGVGALLSNDLEAPAKTLKPELKQVLRLGRGAGADGAVVSGSGPTCAFLSAEPAQAELVAERLAASPLVRSVVQAHGPVPGAQVVEVNHG